MLKNKSNQALYKSACINYANTSFSGALRFNDSGYREHLNELLTVRDFIANHPLKITRINYSAFK